MNEISRVYINRTPIIKNLNNGLFIFITYEYVETNKKYVFSCDDPPDFKLESINASYRLNISPLFLDTSVEGILLSGSSLNISVNYMELCDVTYSPNELYDILSNMNGGALLVSEYESQPIDGSSYVEYDMSSYDFDTDNYGFWSVNNQVLFNKLFVEVICPQAPIIRSINYSWRYDQLIYYNMVIEKVQQSKYDL